MINTAHTSSGSEPLTTNANSAKLPLINTFNLILNIIIFILILLLSLIFIEVYATTIKKNLCFKKLSTRIHTSD